MPAGPLCGLLIAREYTDSGHRVARLATSKSVEPLKKAWFLVREPDGDSFRDLGDHFRRALGGPPFTQSAAFALLVFRIHSPLSHKKEVIFQRLSQLIIRKADSLITRIVLRGLLLLPRVKGADGVFYGSSGLEVKSRDA